jgi:hypothetical protein
MAVQIFVSYSRDDNAPPPGLGGGEGIVTSIVSQLGYEFQTNLGRPFPVLWQDKSYIDRADQFRPILNQALVDSAILLVVLSRNWMARPDCRDELETFAKLRAGEGPSQLKRRIVVLAKNYVERDDRPPLLQGQEGYSLFHRTERSAAGDEFTFFDRGAVRDQRYFEVVRALGSRLWRVAQELSPSANEVATPVVVPPSPEPAPAPVPPPSEAGKKRTIYLAKPASDMRQPYARLVEELSQRDYAILPPPGEEIPYDETAKDYIATALGNAEASVHLVGERPGYTPENGGPIVAMQLAAAGERIAGTPEAGFRRIIWAPRQLAESNGAVAGGAADRDPLAVIDALDRHLDGDKIESRALSDFVSFLIAHLDRTAPRAAQTETLGPGAAVYLFHKPEDTGYALGLAQALKQRQMRPVLPALEGDPAELERVHRRKLIDCDAVVLCWAAASEVWVHAQSDGLKDWRDFGRRQKFAFRSVVAGPPPGIRKQVFVAFPPDGEIDLVLDLTDKEVPEPEALDPLIRAAHSDFP